ncbi:enoyl-[acyl-carrier-protein] reductase, mitochondrial-like [Lineus longissimus]|uniref:enoyl-[acyl-carrier-protein] reductase, mitochondrial-like n=1 Tax=Lineus longissimus TaxID=88925 RepID=UPI00315DDDEE
MFHKFTAVARVSRCLVQLNQVRCTSTFKDTFSIVYKNYGDPVVVLQKEKLELPKVLQPEQVLVRFLAAPINPADLTMIEGKYPIKPALPAVGGNEGVATVVATGGSVKGIIPGDWVIPAGSGFGTWRTHAVCKPHELRKIDNDIPVVRAATMACNPCTAYRMLHDFVMLKPGDTVIQNAANSAVGQAVIQIAAKLGLKTVNIIRDRENRKLLIELLKDLGATMVFTEEELRKPEAKEAWKILPKPRLALNGVGGKSATEIARHIEKGGIMVTYGGMSREPVTMPTGSFIFNDLQLRGFWMTEWNRKNLQTKESSDMLSYICNMIRHGELQQPLCEVTHMHNFKDAIDNSVRPFKPKKVIMLMQEEVDLPSDRFEGRKV